MKQYNTAKVANSFLALAEKEKIPIDQMKLQQMLYFAQELFYQRHFVRFIDTPFIAMDYGIVNMHVYLQTSKYGSSNIPPYVRLYEEPCEDETRSMLGEDSKKEWSAVLDVWDKYKNEKPVTLSDITHKQGAAWCRAREEAAKEGARYKEIPEEYIKKYPAAEWE